jgi:hypothetical protein
MNLCATCDCISFVSLDSLVGNDSSSRHLANGCELRESARRCSLCFLIEEALTRASWGSRGQELDYETRPPLQLSAEPITLRPKSDSSGNAFPHPPGSGLFLSGFIVSAVEATTKKTIRGKIRLLLDSVGAPYDWGDEVYDIVGRPELSNPSCFSAFSLLSKWMIGCKAQHTLCRQTLSGNRVEEGFPTKLPRRVLAVDGGLVRLVESEGMTGRYVALSHCWGPPERQPLTTTLSNLKQHYDAIDWDKIPKTFQDAITVVREIGLRYLWIDSLCIIQDDKKEWSAESRQMGSIYENAELTIAGSHTRDPWQGFLLPRAARPPAVILPRFFPPGKHPGVNVFATIRRGSASDAFPERGALSRRAWVTQEWLLSRRMIFYTPTMMIWCCKTLSQRENGENYYNTARDAGWKTIVEHYSDRLLTYPTDKLIALEGLRIELGKKTEFGYICGIWKESLPDQLLWQVVQKVKAKDALNPLQLPSWTWAHLPVGVRFLQLAKAKNLCESISVHGDGRILALRVRAKRLPAVKNTLDEKENSEATGAIISDISMSNAKATNQMASYMYNEENSCMGWFVSDHINDNLSLDSIFCLALMGTRSRRDEDMERRMNKPISSKLREYWVLIVRHSESGAYERIGVGKTYNRDWWHNSLLADLDLV